MNMDEERNDTRAFVTGNVFNLMEIEEFLPWLMTHHGISLHRISRTEGVVKSRVTDQLLRLLLLSY